ncbi:MAG: helix-turn-helix domain containing protein [Crocinitomicaceae bacterium]|nr:helix-turn-helix domain containing protein [Crocinitomicaceae bacterium]
MTEKQQNILNSALRLFATEGVDSTSTSKIAKHAGVSEGLIFRHFTNKEGLLQAILENGREKSDAYFHSVMQVKDPKERLLMTLHLPFVIPSDEYDFWRLFYTLKWQRGPMEHEGMNLFRNSMKEAFEELGYTNPSAEAQLVEALIDGVATEVLLKEIYPKPLLDCILEKYKLK